MLELSVVSSFAPDLPVRVLQMVLIGTGEPVDLIHVEDDDVGRRYFIERPCGARLMIDESQLGCRGFRLN